MLQRRKHIADTEESKSTMIKELLKNPIAITRELNNRSLFHFVETFWHVYSNDPFVPNWHIIYLCEELEKIAYQVGNRLPKINDILINIPPGTTKTALVCVFFPAWCWTKWYWMKFITVSYSKDLALESAEYCRDLIRSREFKTVYPELDIKDDKDTKSNFKVIKLESIRPNKVPRVLIGGNRYSTSVGGTLTGFHGHIIIWDDPINPKEAVSEVGLATANRFIDHTLPTRKTDKKVSTIIGIMQRLHENDPTGHILKKNKKKLKHICLPGEIKNYKKKVRPIELICKYSESGLLDEKRLGWDELNELEADLGQYGYAGQIGQDPTPPGGGMFKVDRFQIIEFLPNDVNFVSWVRYWDKAGTADKGCKTVGVKMVSLRNGKFIITDVKKGQWAAEDRESIIRSTAEADGKNVEIGIEQEPGSGGKESAEATVRNLAGFSIFKDLPHGDKVKRADPFSVQVNNGNVLLLRGDWNQEYIDELRLFPFSTYKDQVDASSAAFNHLTAKRKAGRIT